jgi:hypothetical protein
MQRTEEQAMSTTMMRRAKAAKASYDWRSDPMYAGCEEPRTVIRSVDDVSRADREWWASYLAAIEKYNNATRPGKPASRVAKMWARPGWRR